MDLGFIITTIMTLRSSNYSCGPQLNIAVSAAHDRHFLRKPHPRHTTSLLPSLRQSRTRDVSQEDVLGVVFQHFNGLECFNGPLHV